MLNSVEAMLEQNARWREHPGLRGAACFGGGLALSALQIGGQMQPAVMGLIMATRGWECCASAVGSGLGYLLFWGRSCGAGLFWVVGAFLLTLLNPGKYYLVVGGMALAAVAGIIQQDNLLIPLTVAGLSTAVGCWENRGRRDLALGAGTMAVACRSPCLGVLLGGFGAASMSMPAALAITVGADLGSGWYHVTIAAAISYYFRKICKRRDYSRSISLIFAVAAVMVLGAVTANGFMRHSRRWAAFWARCCHCLFPNGGGLAAPRCSWRERRA